jgi:hypothetical protein
MVFICGCNSTGVLFTTTINSVTSNQLPKEKTYWISTFNNSNNEFSLRDKSRLKVIERMLSDAGFMKADKISAQYTLKVSLGISDPKTKTGSTPIFGQTGVSSSTTYGNVSSSGSFNATTYNTPSFGIVGSNSYSYSSYTRFLIVRGFDNKEEEVFDSRSVSSGTSGDIDRVLPVLAYNMIPYVGKNTSKSTTVNLRENEEMYLKWLTSLNP